MQFIYKFINSFILHVETIHIWNKNNSILNINVVNREETEI